jgi:hypothetical protein
MRGAVAPFVLAVLACGSDGAGPALEAVAAGRRPLADVTITYREETPRERTVEITVAGDGALTVTTRRPREPCDAGGCWDVATRRGRLAAGAHRALVGTLAAPGLAAVPREVDVAPGAPRLQLVVTVGGERIEVLAGVAAAEGVPEMRRARAALLALEGGG